MNPQAMYKSTMPSHTCHKIDICCICDIWNRHCIFDHFIMNDLLIDDMELYALHTTGIRLSGSYFPNLG